MIFSVPNLEEQLRRKYTNALNFEHTYFITEPYINWLLHNNQFEIIEQQYFLEEHSIFYCCRKNLSLKKLPLPKNLYGYNKKLFQDYIRYYQDLVFQLNYQIEGCQEHIFLFGAHIFSQYLIAFGLHTEKIEWVLDNDDKKQGKRLYGTKLMVASPKVLHGLINPRVILKCGSYNDEIKTDILDNINNTTIFLE